METMVMKFRKVNHTKNFLKVSMLTRIRCARVCATLVTPVFRSAMPAVDNVALLTVGAASGRAEYHFSFTEGG